TLYALFEDTTLHIAPIDVSGNPPTVGNVLDTAQTAATTTRIAASNGIVVINAGNNLTLVYENVGGTVPRDRAETTRSDGLAAVPTPVTNNATAEFVATGAGTRWYGIYPQGMTPGGVT